MTTPERFTSGDVPIRYCDVCGLEHPITREHCQACGMPSVFARPTGYCAKPECREQKKKEEA